MRHVAQQAEDFIGLARRQHRCRLVQDQKALVEPEQLEKFELQLFPGRQRRHGPVERHAERHARQKGFKRRALLLPVDEGRGIGAADDKVLGGGERGHQGEMLVDHADAQRLRLARIADAGLPPVEQQLPLVGRIKAHDAFDQHRFARTILAQKRMERTAGNFHANIVQRHQRAEHFGHADGFERRRAAGGSGNLAHAAFPVASASRSAIMATGPPPSGPWCSAPPET